MNKFWIRIISLNDNNETKCKNKDVIRLNNRKVEELSKNAVKFTRRHIVMRLTLDKCGQYGRVDMYAKKQHLVLTFVVKSNHKKL